jgi:predicted amidophosphoribosyltransferase
MMLLSYALFYQRDSVFIFAYAFTWVPYIRNLVLHRRQSDGAVVCPQCAAVCEAEDRFCARCGSSLEVAASRGAA